ncbi:Uncharacterised protein [Mycobacteroides abscessus subsp. abscessus]|nr:Uncharacterised protein [Mycobacteroides abscessus subsp. abscessus]
MSRNVGCRCSVAVEDLLDDGAGGTRDPHGVLRAALRFLVAGAFGDGDAVDLDQFVDHARSRGAAAGDQRGSDAVGVDGLGAQRRDRIFVEVTGDDDLGVRGTQFVELLADLPCQHT